jgi:hypothetical protein
MLSDAIPLVIDLPKPPDWRRLVLVKAGPPRQVPNGVPRGKNAPAGRKIPPGTLIPAILFPCFSSICLFSIAGTEYAEVLVGSLQNYQL